MLKKYRAKGAACRAVMKLSSVSGAANVMRASGLPAGVLVAALDMVDGVASSGLPPAHVGLHAGPVLSQAGDYFGETVNLASRIAEHARPGEVLVSQEVVDASEDAGPTFTRIGPAELKGISGPVQLYAAHRGVGPA